MPKEERQIKNRYSGVVADAGCYNSLAELAVAKKADLSEADLSGANLSVDFAKNAESWGAVGFRARNVAEFRTAVEKALLEKGPVIIDAKVRPKSMTKGYDSWWRVGTAEVSDNPAVVKAAAEVKTEVAKARKY